MNKVMLIGNVGKDPEVRYYEADTAGGQGALGNTGRNGTKVPDRTDWHTVVFWKSLAKAVEKYVHKGDKLFVEGKVRYRSYDDKQGKRQYVTEIWADSLELLTPRAQSKTDVAQEPKAQPEHIMRWPSPWSEGFPGWHCECTAMGRKYLGEEFDIHGGGMDLIFPHHECEIAQAVASQKHPMVHYWMHNNMITIAGKKMGKSYNNFITLDEFFSGSHELLSQPFSPMTIRFFILQAHYRSTLDFSNDALIASQKGLERLMDALRALDRITPVAEGEMPKGEVVTAEWVADLRQRCYDAMDDDLNSPIVISYLFEACRTINSLADGKMAIAAETLAALREVFHTFCFDILGLTAEEGGNAAREAAFSSAIDLLLEVRAKAKSNKDWATSDQIRDQLAALGFAVKDTKDGATWKLER